MDSVCRQPRCYYLLHFLMTPTLRERRQTKQEWWLDKEYSRLGLLLILLLMSSAAVMAGWLVIPAMLIGLFLAYITDRPQ